ncbi:MAG: SDR family oxidoreductase [Mycobacteriaceae bacterium]|nr:SDR family oxidoreductase [Mycobacteriaceae bacterium]
MTVVVSGSASGIGAAAVQRLRRDGREVLGVDLRGADVVADLADAENRTAAVASILERCSGSLDGVVLCAGLGPHVSDPQRVVDVNYHGALALLDGLFPALQNGSEPAAVVVSSVASTHITWADNPIRTGTLAEAFAQAGDFAGSVAYASSKNALTVAVRTRTPAWGAAGVRLNTVAPGSVDTPLLQAGLDDPRYGALIRDFTAPIGRTGSPAEIAALIGYLLGPQAGFIHGAQFVIDGGSDAVLRPTAF